MPADNTERNARIVALWNEGLSTTAIGVALGISRNVVAGVVKRARDHGETVEARGMPVNIAAVGGGGPRRLAARDARILALRNAGLSLLEVARRTGLSEGAVASVIRRARASGQTVFDGRASSPVVATILDRGGPRLSADPHEPIGCRWIDGDVRRDWAYCNRATPAGESWCTAHRARVYRADLPPMSRERIASLLRIAR